MDEEDAGPGPGEYTVPSAVAARTAISTVRSIPGMKFGTSIARPSVRQMATGGPGPGANFRLERPGVSSDSRRPNVPVYSLRPKTDAGGPLERAMRAKSMPGPAAYSAGDDPKLRRSPAVSMSFRHSDAEAAKRALGPAPGQYNVGGGLGSQVLSTKRTSGGVSFGKAKRSAGARATSEVGPGEYAAAESVGKQLLSSRPTAPRVVMAPRREPHSASDRFRAGPGSYTLRGGTGSQVLSTIRTAPAARMSGRTKFGSYM